ncbi:MAG TPA: hypothetical protein VKG21_21240 [Casimicrobiaceae bacterium]|nr:hypothetical protein [Casimicrobiaceae bacterium]
MAGPVHLSSLMRIAASIAVVFVCLALHSGSARALDKVNTYICPTQFQGSGIDCFLEAVPQTYTMCRHIKHIEIIEFGMAGAQEGVNGAKTESCIDKHKLLLTLPYQAALREAARNKEEVEGLRKLYDTWLDSLAKLIPQPAETNEVYLKRVSLPYVQFNEQIAAIRALDKNPVAAETKPPPKAPAKKKPTS